MAKPTSKPLTPLMQKQIEIYNIWGLTPKRVSAGGFLGYSTSGRCYSVKVVDITCKNPKFTVYRNILNKSDVVIIALYINNMNYQNIRLRPYELLSTFANNVNVKTIALHNVWPFCRSPMFKAFLSREKKEDVIQQLTNIRRS